MRAVLFGGRHNYPGRIATAAVGGMILPRLETFFCIPRSWRAPSSASVKLMVSSENRFREAAVKCLEAAEKTADPKARAVLVVSALKWLELADERYVRRRFDLGLDQT